MDLFPADATRNLLLKDGEAFYHGALFGSREAECLFETLMLEVPWERDELVMFGKRIVTDRKVAWFGDENFPYKYSGSLKQAMRWTPTMRRLRDQLQSLTGSSFNSCLANLYHHGGEGMSWHSDDENTLVSLANIASLSFGAERKFRFRHKESKETVDVYLENGSLLEMKGATQMHWQHCLPKTKKVEEPRINLTFRLMKD